MFKSYSLAVLLSIVHVLAGAQMACAQRAASPIYNNQGLCLSFCKSVLFSKDSKEFTPKFKSNELAIVSSKVYAQYEATSDSEPFNPKYGLRVLLNKYQISPRSGSIRLRSKSLFVIQPTVGGVAQWGAQGAMEVEYGAGLHWATNQKVEQQVEQVKGHRILGWVAKATVRFHLQRFKARKISRA